MSGRQKSDTSFLWHTAQPQAGSAYCDHLGAATVDVHALRASGNGRSAKIQTYQSRVTVAISHTR